MVEKPTENNQQQNAQNSDHLSFLPDTHQNATIARIHKKYKKIPKTKCLKDTGLIVNKKKNFQYQKQKKITTTPIIAS